MIGYLLCRTGWAAFVLLLFGMTEAYALEPAITVPHGSKRFETCRPLAPPTVVHRVSTSSREADLASELFHLHRLQATCDDARSAQWGCVALGGLAIVAIGASHVLGKRTGRLALASVLLLVAAYFTGSFIVDGPILAEASLAAGAGLHGAGLLVTELRLAASTGRPSPPSTTG